MPSELNLCDFLINKLSERNGVMHMLTHFPQIKKHEAFLTLPLSWTQARIPKCTSRLCVDRHNLRATLRLIDTRVTALSWMTVFSPALCSVPMSLGHPGVYSPSLWATEVKPHYGSAATGCGCGSCPGGALGNGAVGRLDALACSLRTLASHPLPGQLDLVENGTQFVWARFASGEGRG